MKRLNRREFAVATGISATALANRPPLAAEEPAVAVELLPGKTPHTKFAVNIEMWFRRLPFLERIRAAAELGFPAIEFWDYQQKKNELQAIATTASELGVEIAQFTAWGFDPGMNHPANEDRFVAQVEQACHIAKQLNCRKMTVVAGNDQKGMTSAAMLAQVTKALRRVAPIVEANEVMIILEPMNGRVDHPGHCLYGSPDALRICREVASPYIKINWDLYHMQITEGDLCGRLRDGFDQIGYLQLADHPGRHEPGTGEINFSRVLRAAYELGYRDIVGLECSPATTELAAAEAVARADQW